jgi:glycosyltransferase involved in cell wall biosynthesis
MRVALVNTSRGWGGAEEQMLALAGELGRRGHVVSIVARAGAPVHAGFLRVGHEVLPVARTGQASLPAPLRLAARIRRRPPDIVHSHRDHDLPLSKLLSLASGAPLLLTQHCMPPRPHPLAYGLADRIVAVSEYIAGGIRARVPAVAARVSVIHNGIDPATFTAPDRSYWQQDPRVRDRSPLLGVVGAFYKNQEELIAMLPRLRGEFPLIALVLIGEDEGRKQPLVDLAERLEVTDAVVFAGRIPRERMKDALAGLDVNASAFRNEGFGLSVLEGLAVGTPFVGYRAGGYPEIVRDVRSGILVDGKSGLAEAVAALLHSRALRSGAREQNGLPIPDVFLLPGMADAYEQVYSEMRKER